MSTEANKILKFGAVTVIILLSLGYLAYTGVQDSKSYYVTIKELQGMGDGAYSKRLRVAGSSQFIAVVTLHVYRPIAQKAVLDKSPHAPRYVAELIIVSGGYLQTFSHSRCNHCSSLVETKRERLLHIDVASRR